MVNHNPSKTDVRPPNYYKKHLYGRHVTFWQRPLDGLWLIIIRPTRPLNPRFKDAHTGTKRLLDVKMNNRESGILGTASNGRFRNVTIPLRAFILEMFGGRTSVLDAL